MIKDFFTRLFTKGAASSLNASWMLYNSDMPIQSFDKPGKAITHGYNQSDIVYSIVSKKARAGARAPFGVYRVKSVTRAKEYKYYIQQKDFDFNKALQLKEDAFEPKGHELTERYANPNLDVSEFEYTEILLTYLNLTGNCYEYAQRVKGGNRIIGLHAMPSDLMIIKGDGKFPIGISGYQLYMGQIKEFGREEVIHAKYPNPNWSPDGKHLYGLSPIQSGWNLIDADNEGWDAVRDQRRNRGARKLVGIQSDVVKTYLEGKELVKKASDYFNNKFNSEYKDKVAPIFGTIQVADIGLSEKDMQILASHQMTFDRLCNLWHVPTEWFNTSKQSKYNNLHQYNKQAIINGVLPDLNKLQSARNRWAIENGLIQYGKEQILYDPSVFTELEVDRKDMMSWLKDSPYTLNEQRVFLGDEPINNPNMDQVYIGRNKISIDKINEERQETNTAGGRETEEDKGGEEK